MKVSEVIGYLEHTLRRFGDIDVFTFDPHCFEEGDLGATDIGFVVLDGSDDKDGNQTCLMISDLETAQAFADASEEDDPTCSCDDDR